MSKVDRIELHHVDVPLDEPFHPSWIPGYPQTSVRFTLIRVRTDDGLEGISAGTAFSREREGLGDLLGGFLLGVDADDIDRVRKRLREASYLGWRNWWIEAAFRDLKGQMEDKPVYKLLQENEETVTKAPVYASSGEVRPFEERQPWLEYPYEPPGCSPKGRWACRPRAKASATRGTGNDTKSGCRRPPEPRSG